MSCLIYHLLANFKTNTCSANLDIGSVKLPNPQNKSKTTLGCICSPIFDLPYHEVVYIIIYLNEVVWFNL